MANSKDVKLTLAVETTGTGGIKELAGSLGDVSAAGKNAAPGVEKLVAELTALEVKTKDLRTAESTARSEVSQLKNERAALSDTLAKLRVETTTSAKGTDAYKDQERLLRLELIEGRAALRAKQTALESATTSARVAASAEAALTNQIATVNAAYRQSGVAASQAAAQQAQAAQTVKGHLSGLGDQLRSIQTLATAALGGSALVGVATSVAGVADSYKQLEARVKLATGAQGDSKAAFEGIFEVAQRTNSSLQATGDLYNKISASGKALNLNSQDALRLTESINQATQLSGASAESANAALVQLSQSLASGVLRGDELNSIFEQAPRLTKALSDGLGVTTGELRKMGEQGALTSATVIAALQGQSAALQKEFETLPLTVGKAFQNVSTAFTKYIGEADNARGGSTAAANAVNLLAQNLDTVAALLFAAGKAALAYQAVSLAATFLKIGTSATVATVEITAMTAATNASTVASAGASAGASRFASIIGGIKLGALALVVTNLKDIGVALGEGVAKLMGYTDGVKESEAATKLEAQATRDQAQAKAALSQQLVIAAEKGLGLNEVSRKLVADFDEMRLKGDGVTDSLAKIAKSFELKDLSGIANAGAALDALAVKGKITADDIALAFSNGLKGVDLALFATNATAAFDKSEAGARRLAAALDAVSDEALRRAGLSVRELQTGFSTAFVSAVNDTDALTKALDKLGIKSVETGKALAGSLDKALAAATTEKAVKAVIERLEELGKRGLITGDQLSEGLEKARGKIDGLLPGIQTLNEALGNFGLKSREELLRTADTMKASYAKIANSVSVSLAEKKIAFEQYSKAAIAANGGVESSEITLQREILKIKSSVETVGDSITQQMGRAGDALDSVSIKAREVAKELERVEKERQRVADITPSRGRGAIDARGSSLLEEKRRTGTLSADDLALAQAAFDSARINSIQRDANFSAFSNDGNRSINEEQLRAQTILDQVKALVQLKQQPQQNTQQNNPTRTININIGGRTTPVNVSSQADADALTAVLRQLESAKRTS